MSEKYLFSSYAQMITAVDYCISNNLIIPALVLIYSVIDSISWVASDDDDKKGSERFQNWVDIWMLQKYPLPCTSIELYAARCGILHTLTPESNLNKKKGVRRVFYAWGKARQMDLDKSIKLLNYPGLTAVHVNDIFDSFKSGFADFIESLDKDPTRKKLFTKKAAKHFTNIGISIIDEFIASS